jgi:hypothetical protein
VSQLRQSTAAMNGADFAAIIRELSRRPLLDLHLGQLQWLEQKEAQHALSEVDKIYLADLWEKFRSLPPAPDARSPGASAETPSDASLGLTQELKRLNVTVEKLREALKRVAEHRDELKTEVDRLKAIAAAAESDPNHRRFEKAKLVFAKFYHPNAVTGRSRLDAAIRVEVFKEFWVELQKIEAQG